MLGFQNVKSQQNIEPYYKKQNFRMSSVDAWWWRSKGCQNMAIHFYNSVFDWVGKKKFPKLSFLKKLFE